MKYLLDTHVLLLAAADYLPKLAKKYFSEENELYFSPASIWEIETKRALFSSYFQIDTEAFYAGLLAAGYKELPVTTRHVLVMESLPKTYTDPFDRILLSQVEAERLYLITSDADIAKYHFRIIFLKSIV